MNALQCALAIFANLAPQAAASDYESSFPGGPVTDLAQHIAWTTKTGSILLVDAEAPVRKFRISRTDLATWQKQIFAKSQFKSTDSIGWAAPRWPQFIFLRDRHASSVAGLKLAGKGEQPSLRDGRVTWKLGNRVVVLGSTVETAFQEKNLTIHWFFHQMPLAVQAENLPLEQFFAGLAHALGGKFLTVEDKETKKTRYVIDFDPAEFRRRTLEAMKVRLPPNHRFETARHNLMIGILETLSNDTLYNGFRKEDSGASQSMPAGHRILKQVEDLERAWRDVIHLFESSGDRDAAENARASYAATIAAVDFTKAFKIGFNNRNCGFNVVLPRKEGGGWVALP